MPKKQSSKIDETLKKITAASLKANIPTSSSAEATSPRQSDLPGDPDCPHCHGLGYLRMEVPLGHPEFGKVEICPCRQSQVNQQVRQRLFNLSHLDELSHLTFENFNPRGRMGYFPQQASSLELANNATQQFARTLNGWLILQGGFGCGKTHLAAAIANFAVSLGVPTLFITVPDLLDTLRFAYHDPEATFEERFDEIRRAPLLILDDFGTQNATPWAQEKLFQIINYRYINRLPTVVTSNLTEGDIEERISSRFQDPELVTRVRILAPDYRDPTGDTGHPELSSLEMLHKCTFANFDLRQSEGLPLEDLHSLEKIFNAARIFAEAPKGWLVIVGEHGSGKTHLAAAIGHFVAEVREPPTFIVVPELLDRLRATFSPTSNVTLDRRFEIVRTARLLILDDLGTQYSTPWAQEKLYQLFNYRYNAELPTVITTAIPLEEMDARLRSRMLDKRLCSIYTTGVPPYTGGPSISRSSSSRHKRTHGRSPTR